MGFRGFSNRLLLNVTFCVSLCAFKILLLSCFLLQNAQSTLFAIDRHSGVLRIKSGEMLDYEKTKTHFVTVIAKVLGASELIKDYCHALADFHCQFNGTLWTF